MRSIFFTLLLLGGCTTEPDPAIVVRGTELRHAPGAEFEAEITWDDGGALTGVEVSAEGLTIVSEVDLGTRRDLVLRGDAPGVGALVVTRDGVELARFDTVISQPWGVLLQPLEVTEGQELSDLGDRVRILAGAGAFFRIVTVDEDGYVVESAGLVSAESPAPGDLGVDVAGSPEILVLSPDVEGIWDVVVTVSGGSFRTFRVIGVPESEIANLELEAPDEEGRSPGSRICLDLIATNSTRERVWGPYADWTVNGALLSTMGDRLCYDYAPDAAPSTVVASIGGAEHTASIRGTEFGAATAVGCTAAPGRPGQGGALILFVLLGIAQLVRRTRERI
jgi:hypothetical protein